MLVLVEQSRVRDVVVGERHLLGIKEAPVLAFERSPLQRLH
jgi:hypothetical protein